MIKPVITLDIDTSSFKDIMEGTQLLNAQINWERMHENKSPVCIHEDYFLRSAIQSYLESLRSEMKTENFN